MKMPRGLVAIIGNTGVGKSQLSIEIAKALNGEIINGDSMQMYRGLDTITNKHPVKEREGIPHHLLGHVPWSEEYSVKQFEDEALSLVEDIHSRGKLPILVGGTHYYIQSVLFKNATIASTPNIAKAPLSDAQSSILDTPSRVLEELTKVDPLVAQKFHPNDTRRLRRALEVYYTTGKKTSDIYSEQRVGTDETSTSLRFDPSLVLWIWCDKKVLDDRLDARVDQMLEATLYDEIKQLYSIYTAMTEAGTSVDLERGIWQVIGFKEFLPWLQGVETSPESGIAAMKQATRAYAGRQTKWIRKKLLDMVQLTGTSNFGILDSTDLANWHQNVSDRGVALCKQVLEGSTTTNVSMAPDDLVDLLQPRDADDTFSSSQWKHYVCEVCKRKDGSKAISIGKPAWDIHVNSKKHRANVKYEKRKSLHQMYMAKKIVDRNGAQSTNENEHEQQDVTATNTKNLES